MADYETIRTSRAGAANSPKLLHLSGVGPGSLIADLGVEQVVDLPGVGAGGS